MYFFMFVIVTHIKNKIKSFDWKNIFSTFAR